MREMKESNISWVGEMPCSWKIEKNKHCFQLEKNIVGENKDKFELLSLTKKGIIKKDESSTGGKVPESFETYQSVKKGQLVMCLFDLDVSAVFSGLSNYDGMISPAYKVYNCNKIIDKNYAKYWFEFCFDGRKYKAYSKSLRYVVNTEDFGPIEILLPPKEEQEKIAEFLYKKIAEIDTVIDKTKETIEDYKKYKQLLITDVVTHGLNKNVEMNNSGVKWIGIIPKTWKIIKLKFLFEVGSLKIGPFGSALTGKTLAEGPVKIYNQANLIENNFALSRHYIDEETFNELKNYEIIPGDILFSMMGTVGKCKIMPDGYSKGIMDSHLIKARLNNNLILNEFFEYVYDKDYSNVIIEQLLYYSNGTIMNGLNSTILKNVSIAIPDINEQLQIVNYLKKKTQEIDNLIDSKSKIIEELEQYKKSLIYEYVTGKKEVV